MYSVLVVAEVHLRVQRCLGGPLEAEEYSGGRGVLGRCIGVLQGYNGGRGVQGYSCARGIVHGYSCSRVRLEGTVVAEVSWSTVVVEVFFGGVVLWW